MDNRNSRENYVKRARWDSSHSTSPLGSLVRTASFEADDSIFTKEPGEGPRSWMVNPCLDLPLFPSPVLPTRIGLVGQGTVGA